MTLSVFGQHSLKARVTLLTLGIFLLGIWSLAWYASQTLHQHMQRLLGEQQFSTTSIVAAGVNQGLEDRLRALERVAASIDSDLLAQPAALQMLLEQRPVLQTLFNAGVFVTRADGTAVADVPASSGRIGINYKDRGNIAEVLRDGRPGFSRPLLSKTLKTPLFGINVPIRDAQGRVIGALVGSTNLGQPNFLDRIGGNAYGKTGGYLLTAPKYRQIISSTDKRRVMEVLPPAGVNPTLDRFIEGYEGSAVFVNPQGVEVLASVKGVPLSGWTIATLLPTAEAFAPIHEVQRRVVLAALALSLLAAGLVWWTLSHQLAPILTTIHQLASMTEQEQPMQSLSIERQDEIGQLIGSFNQLLQTLARRSEALRASEELFGAVAAVAPIGIYLTDHHGSCLYTNARWCEMAGMDSQHALGLGWAAALHPDDRAQVTANWAHMVQSDGRWGFEYRFQSVGQKITWVYGLASPVKNTSGEVVRYVGINVDITQRKQIESALQRSVHEKQALLQEVHHRVKNNLQVITSLLRLESRRSTQADTKSVLVDMQNRIRSMSLLHETLYRSGNFASVDLGSYLKQLGTQAFRANLNEGGRVSLRLALDSATVPMEQATTCGLLVNELISNSLKHGFVQGRSGEVCIELQATDDGSQLRLQVSDTGIGLPADFAERRAQSLGLQLATDLAHQLGSTLEIGAGVQALFSVTFAVDQSKLTPATGA